MVVSTQLHDQAALTLGKDPGIHWIASWMTTRTGLDAVKKKIILLHGVISQMIVFNTHTAAP
jgi:hypothetical protein